MGIQPAESRTFFGGRTTEISFLPEKQTPILETDGEVSVGRAAPDTISYGQNIRSRPACRRVPPHSAGRRLPYDARLYKPSRHQPLQRQSGFIPTGPAGSGFVPGDPPQQNAYGAGDCNRGVVGAAIHLEGKRHDFITLEDARPNTVFARDIFPGSTFGLIQLSHVGIVLAPRTDLSRFATATVRRF